MYLLLAGCGALLPTWAPWRGVRPVVEAGRSLVGAVEARWLFSASPDSDEQRHMFDLAGRGLQVSDAFGCVFYMSSSLVALKEPCALEAGTGIEPHQLLERCQAHAATWTNGDNFAEGTFGDMLNIMLSNTAGVFIATVSVALAQALLQRQWTLLHAAILSRRQRGSSMLGGMPTQKELSQLRKRHCGPRMVGGASALETRRRSAHDRLPAELILKFLDATRYLTNERCKEEAAEAFAALMTRSSKAHARLMRDLEDCNREVLRKARVRLDCVAMLLVRAFLKMLAPESMSLHLFTDESPQKRGRMLLASSMDVCHQLHEGRLLLPMVCLARGCLDQMGKLAGLVWQLFLVIGLTRLRKFCDTVRSVTTDMGTERLIATADDHLALLLRHYGCPEKFLPRHQGGKLFRYAVHIRGWRHTWDLIGCK